jgi:hypothetical protein
MWLAEAGWNVGVEVTYSQFGERGAFDILAFRDGVVLVVEVKTDVASAEGTLRKLDGKARLALLVARERLGWEGRHVGRLLVLADTSTLRRRVRRHEVPFARALPVRGQELRRWLRGPSSTIAGLWFLSSSTSRARIQQRGGRERIRKPKTTPPSTPGAI